MIKFRSIVQLVNCEGCMVELLRSENKVYLKGKSSEGRTIICETNREIIYLYLTRVTLIEAFLLSSFNPYFITKEGQSTAQIFETDSNNNSIPEPIENLAYGNELFQLIPKNSRTEKSITEIMGLLPKVYDGVKVKKLDNLQLAPGSVKLFSNNSPFEIVQIENEEFNPYEHDYLKANLAMGNGSVLCRMTPMSMKLLITGRVSISEIMRCQANSDYFLINELGYYQFKYSNVLEGHINAISLGDFSYYTIPSKYTIEKPLVMWDYYMKNIVLTWSGHTVLPIDYEKEYPLKIKIERIKI